MAGLREVIFAICMGFLAIYYYKSSKSHIQTEHLRKILAGLIREENRVNVTDSLRVAVGFGSCIDLVVDALPLLEELSLKPPKRTKHHNPLKDRQGLAETFAYFMKEGAASERYVDPKFFQDILKVAKNVARAKWTGGGNAPVIGKRLLLEGIEQVLIGSLTSKNARKYFYDKLQFLGDTAKDDDIHIIMEYKVGNKWGNHTVPRANRFIIHSDSNNPMLGSLEAFLAKLDDFAPHLVIVSALQMLDNFPFKAGERGERLEVLKNVLKTIPVSTHVHFEMASFSEKAMVEALLQYVVPYTDSLGMNEQELPNLVSMLKYGDVITVADANPRTAVVLDDMRELYYELNKKNVRKVSRIHVHTLAFQAVLTTNNSTWKNTKSSSAKASLVANRHTCGSHEIDITKAKLIMDDSFSVSTKPASRRILFDADNPISCWNEDIYEICIAPVLVCTQVVQTVGGGDNITPAGLVLQL